MDEKEIYAKLAAPFPAEAIQRTKKEQTRKGYDTTGVGYQFCVNRLNEVLGIGGWTFPFPEILEHTKGTFKNSGAPYHEITVRADIKINHAEIKAERSGVGGHVSSSYADALKGAISNAFKKTVSLFGVGRQAYEGTLDDDTEQPGNLDQAKPEPSKPVDARFAAPRPTPAGNPPPAAGSGGVARPGPTFPPVSPGPAGGPPGMGPGRPPVAPVGGAPVVGPGSPPANIDPKDHEKRMEILGIAEAIQQSNGQSIESLIKEFSKFTGNDGKDVYREDVAHLRGRWLNATLGRARECWNTYSQMIMPPPETATQEQGSLYPGGAPGPAGPREPGDDSHEDMGDLPF